MAVATVSSHRLPPPFLDWASVTTLAFELYSIVKELLFYSYIIQQKEQMFIIRMNLYSYHIFDRAFFKKQKISPLAWQSKKAYYRG